MSELVVDMTAFFTLKKKGGTQPSPEIIAALDGLSKRGIGPASTELGINYLYGTGVPQNDGIAISYLKTAVEQRQPAARFILGQIYLDGKRIMADPVKGSELLTLSAREGFQPAVQLAQKSKINPSRMGMTASELIQLAVRGNRQTVDASNAFINEGLATGYAALAYYAVMYSKDEALKKQATEFAANAARTGLDTGFGALAVIHANPDFGKPNLSEAAMWLALSAKICGEPAACAPAEANLTALKKKLEPSVASYLDHIDEHILAEVND
ncbi:MAG: tetratricopeptide repeat protein [Hyphomicrobium sp.]|uniref:tetratricopeptide repeat protein n=1 Tax=Hyphomicrobium sp. TaxID=82 RepID=UPI0039E4F249